MQWIKIFESEADAKSKIPVTKATLLVVSGQEICLAHTRAGLFAVNNACPHLGDSLSRGTTNYLNEIVCPWHSYRYHLATGEECQGRTKPLQQYSLEMRAEGVFIGLPE